MAYGSTEYHSKGFVPCRTQEKGIEMRMNGLICDNDGFTYSNKLCAFLSISHRSFSTEKAQLVGQDTPLNGHGRTHDHVHGHRSHSGSVKVLTSI